VDGSIVQHQHGGQPGLGPYRQSSRRRKAMKPALTLVGEGLTTNSRVAASSAPTRATLFDWPGALTRNPAPRSAQAWAR
jgi:hypothetical protein